MKSQYSDYARMKDVHAEKVKKVYTFTPEHARAAGRRLGLELDVKEKMKNLNLAEELDILGLRNVL